MSAVAEERIEPLLKLDLGCGPNKKGPDWVGVDSHDFKGVDQVVDLTQSWPWADASVEEIHMSHVYEHFTALERVHICNEAYRVLAKGGKMTIITPHWANHRAYGDPTHQWPPVSEMFVYYLQKDWRKSQAPHTDLEWNPKGFACDFDWTVAHTFDTTANGKFVGRNQEYIGFALANYRDAVMDLQATLIKRA